MYYNRLDHCQPCGAEQLPNPPAWPRRLLGAFLLLSLLVLMHGCG